MIKRVFLQKKCRILVILMKNYKIQINTITKMKNTSKNKIYLEKY